MAAALLLAPPIAAAAQDAPDRAPTSQIRPFSFAPLIERSAPAVVNIYTRKIVHSRSAARILDGAAFWRLFRDAGITIPVAQHEVRMLHDRPAP